MPDGQCSGSFCPFKNSGSVKIIAQELRFLFDLLCGAALLDPDSARMNRSSGDIIIETNNPKFQL